jgi:hypothetical protein
MNSRIKIPDINSMISALFQDPKNADKKSRNSVDISIKIVNILASY